MAEYVVGVGETYETLNSIKALIGVGDIVSIKGDIDDSASGVMEFTNNLTGTIFRSHPDNTQNPTVNLGSSGLSFGTYVDVNGLQINDIKFDINITSNTAIYFTYASGNASINRCEFFNSGVDVENPQPVISHSFSGSILVKNCYFHDLKHSILRAGDGDAYTLDSCLVENITLLNSYGVVRLTYTQDVVKNCIFKNINSPKIVNFDNSGYGDDSLILNNTFYGITGIAIYVYRYAYGNLVVANNIIHGNGGGTGIFISLVHYGTADQDYNCIHAVSTEYAGSAISAPHNIDSTNNPGATDPLFTNAGAGDFTLLDASPCIDAGAGTSIYVSVPVVDYAGNVRPLAPLANWDMGAYERALPPVEPWLVGDFVGADYINLQALVDSGLLSNGDIVELSGTVDDSASGSLYDDYKDVTFRKRVGDVDKPIVLLGTGIHFDYATCSYEDIIFRANGLTFSMISGGGSNVSISRCEFYDDNYSIGTNTGTAIDTSNGQFSIMNCIFKNLAGSATQGESGLDLIDSCYFENVSRSTEGSQPISSLGRGDITVKNCIFKNIGSSVIQTSISDYITIKFLNNTIYSFGEVVNARAININSDYAELYIYNNIIHGNNNDNTIGIYINAPTIIQDYNCVYGCTTAYSGDAVAGPHNVHTDPLFTNADTGDFTLQNLSPCIDTGASTSVYASIPVVDYVGVSRPLAPLANWDMGAYERALASGPQIDVQPLSQQVSGHTNVTFTVEASGGVAPLSYQWKKDGENIEGATSSILLLNSVTDSDQGVYTVVVTDDDEASVESDEAVLVVYVVPRIVIQPIVIYCSLKGSLTITMTVLADADVPLTYQWTRSDVVVSTERNFHVAKVKKEDSGYYVLTVSNEYGVDVSDPVDVRIYSQEDIIEESTKQSTRADVAKKIENILEVKRILKSKNLYL